MWEVWSSCSYWNIKHIKMLISYNKSSVNWAFGREKPVREKCFIESTPGSETLQMSKIDTRLPKKLQIFSFPWNIICKRPLPSWGSGKKLSVWLGQNKLSFVQTYLYLGSSKLEYLEWKIRRVTCQVVQITFSVDPLLLIILDIKIYYVYYNGRRVDENIAIL